MHKQRLFVFKLKIIRFMKKLELQNFGVQELDAKEIREVGGGLPWWLPAAAVVGLVISAVNNFGDIREGFSDGVNSRAPRHKS